MSSSVRNTDFYKRSPSRYLIGKKGNGYKVATKPGVQKDLKGSCFNSYNEVNAYKMILPGKITCPGGYKWNGYNKWAGGCSADLGVMLCDKDSTISKHWDPLLTQYIEGDTTKTVIDNIFECCTANGSKLIKDIDKCGTLYQSDASVSNATCDDVISRYCYANPKEFLNDPTCKALIKSKPDPTELESIC